jgi:hypothetical protein
MNEAIEVKMRQMEEFMPYSSGQLIFSLARGQNPCCRIFTFSVEEESDCVWL